MFLVDCKKGYSNKMCFTVMRISRRLHILFIFFFNIVESTCNDRSQTNEDYLNSSFSEIWLCILKKYSSLEQKVMALIVCIWCSSILCFSYVNTFLCHYEKLVCFDKLGFCSLFFRLIYICSHFLLFQHGKRSIFI